MTNRAIFGLMMAATLAVGCDVSRKTPQVVSLPSAISTPATGAAPPPEASTGGNSIRLFGPGVSRQRQTRV